MRAPFDLFTLVTFAWVLALTFASVISPFKQQSSDSSFGKGFDSSNFQGWGDWLHKRSSTFGVDPWARPGDFQQWDDWMAKKNLGSTGGGRFGSPVQLQKWMDWLSKRSLGSGAGSSFNGGDSSQFQGWSEWLNKRAGLYATLGHAGQTGPWSQFGKQNFQSWGGAQEKREPKA